MVLPSEDFCQHYFENRRTVYNQLFTFTLWSAVRAVVVLFVLIVQFSERKMDRFLDDLRVVGAVNEPVDDSGSERDVSEKEYIAHGMDQWRTEGGFGVFKPPPHPKLRNFDKAAFDCKLSGKCLVFLFQHPN